MARTNWEVTREMFLDEAEVSRLLECVRRPVQTCTGRQRAIAMLDQFIVEGLLYSGLRNSEFCRLTLADTCLGHGQPAFKVAGTRESGRTVLIPEALNRLVLRHVKEARPHFLSDGVAPDDLSQALVFNERRQPYERTGLYRRVVKILAGAGLKDRASVQLLRHTYGYLAYLKTGGNLLFVQQQLGHAHPMVTVVYAKFVHESYADLANLIEQTKTLTAATPTPARRTTSSKGG